MMHYIRKIQKVFLFQGIKVFTKKILFQKEKYHRIFASTPLKNFGKTSIPWNSNNRTQLTIFYIIHPVSLKRNMLGICSCEMNVLTQVLLSDVRIIEQKYGPTCIRYKFEILSVWKNKSGKRYFTKSNGVISHIILLKCNWNYSFLFTNSSLFAVAYIPAVILIEYTCILT